MGCCWGKVGKGNKKKMGEGRGNWAEEDEVFINT